MDNVIDKRISLRSRCLRHTLRARALMVLAQRRSTSTRIAASSPGEPRSVPIPRPARTSGGDVLKTRRVLVVNVDGTSRVVEDGEPPRSFVAAETPGFAQAFVWCT